MCQAALREARDIMTALLGPAFPSLSAGNLRRELNGNEKPSCSVPPPLPRAFVRPQHPPPAALRPKPAPTRAQAHMQTRVCTHGRARTRAARHADVWARRKSPLAHVCTRTRCPRRGSAACSFIPARHQFLKPCLRFLTAVPPALASPPAPGCAQIFRATKARLGSAVPRGPGGLRAEVSPSPPLPPSRREGLF